MRQPQHDESREVAAGSAPIVAAFAHDRYVTRISSCGSDNLAAVLGTMFGTVSRSVVVAPADPDDHRPLGVENWDDLCPGDAGNVGGTAHP